MKNSWKEIDIVLVSNRETRVIGRANISVNGELEALKYITLEEHSFELANTKVEEKITYRHMKNCLTCAHKNK